MNWIKKILNKGVFLKLSFRFGSKMKQKQKWKYFTEQEVGGLSHDLVFKLDRAREFYGHPIIITSGFRTEDQNDAAGGVKNSEHLMGQGCDIKSPLEVGLREKLAWSLGSAGFRRVGTYPLHFHVGISQEHPTPAFWFGNYDKSEVKHVA